MLHEELPVAWAAWAALICALGTTLALLCKAVPEPQDVPEMENAPVPEPQALPERVTLSVSEEATGNPQESMQGEG